MNTGIHSFNERKQVSTALIGKQHRLGYSSLTPTENTLQLKSLKRGLINRKGVENASGSNHANEDDKSKANLLPIDILPTDTLQSLSLQYACSVNDIKRINSLISEQDFYARRTIKIPIHTFGVLTTAEGRSEIEDVRAKTRSAGKLTEGKVLPVPALHTVNNGPTSDALRQSPTLEYHGNEMHVIELNQENSGFSDHSLEAAPLVPANTCRADATDSNDVNGYLKKLDKDIRRTVKKTDFKAGQPHSVEALDEVLSSIQYHPKLPNPRTSDNKSNGADCGIKWWTALLCFFVVLLIIVFLAVFEYNRSKR